MGIKASLVSAGAPLEWIEKFSTEVVGTIKDKLRKTITALREHDSVVVSADGTDLIIALAWYFLVEGWEVRFVYPNLEGLAPPNKKRCLYIFLDPENTHLSKESYQELNTYLLKGSRTVSVVWRKDG